MISPNNKILQWEYISHVQIIWRCAYKGTDDTLRKWNKGLVLFADRIFKFYLNIFFLFMHLFTILFSWFRFFVIFIFLIFSFWFRIFFTLVFSILFFLVQNFPHICFFFYLFFFAGDCPCICFFRILFRIFLIFLFLIFFFGLGFSWYFFFSYSYCCLGFFWYFIFWHCLFDCGSL